jgi:hypothetical protein
MKKIASTILISILLLPASLFSATSTPRTASSTKPLTGFCSQIDNALVAIDGKVIGITKKEVKKDEITIKKIEKRDEIHTQISAIRERNDSKLKEQLTELTKRATTDKEREAFSAFITSVTQAFAVKDKAIDTLLTTYQTEIDSASITRKTATDKALATLLHDIEAAKVKAKNDCANGVSGETVRTTLKESIKKADDAYRKTISSLPKVKDLPLQSSNTRKEELKKIEATFKKSVKQARKDLKAILTIPKTVGSALTSPH